MAVSAELEPFGLEATVADDVEVEKVFGKADAEVVPLDDAAFEQWWVLARGTVWKEYADRSATCAELLKLGEAVA